MTRKIKYRIVAEVSEIDYRAFITIAECSGDDLNLTPLSYCVSADNTVSTSKEVDTRALLTARVDLIDTVLKGIDRELRLIK